MATKKVTIGKYTVFATELKGEGDKSVYGGGKQAYHVVVSTDDQSKYHTGDRQSSERFIKNEVEMTKKLES